MTPISSAPVQSTSLPTAKTAVNPLSAIAVSTLSNAQSSEMQNKSLAASLSAVPAAPKIKETSDKCDEEMQKIASLTTCETEFLAKGGTLVRLEGATKYVFKPNDIVFPSCSGGNNRSQTLYHILRPYAGKFVLNVPHATRYGFDPYNNDWTRIEHGRKSDDQFHEWAGTKKCDKLGWSIFEGLSKEKPSEATLKEARKFYDANYYNPAVNGKRVYITFTKKNAHVHMYRLKEANASLNNVTLMYFPLEDTIAHPADVNIQPRSAESYKVLSKLIEAQLDFTKL